MIAHLKAIPGLYMCFDSNHLLGEANPDFLRRLYEAGLAGRIGSVHISDYDFTDERHELPGNGKNDWPAIVAGLERLDYDGPFSFTQPHANAAGRAVITPAMVAENRSRILSESVSTNTARFAIMKQTPAAAERTPKNDRNTTKRRLPEMTRRESREAAMCLLYEYSYNTHKTPGEIVNAAVENREEKLSGFTRELFTGAPLRLPEIDTILTASADNWRLGRIARVPLAVLRLAVYELLTTGRRMKKSSSTKRLKSAALTPTRKPSPLSTAC